MHHPVRGGVRGGKDQFKWEDIKTDKDRENFLGHSIMAPVGRWQKGKDLHWYVKDKGAVISNTESNKLKDELQRVKEEEEERMNIALGLKPKKRANQEDMKLMQEKEAKEFFKKTNKEENGSNKEREGDRVQGLGFNSAPKIALNKNPFQNSENNSKEKRMEDGSLSNNGHGEEERSKYDRDKVEDEEIKDDDDGEKNEKRKHRKRHGDNSYDEKEKKKKHKKKSSKRRKKDE